MKKLFICSILLLCFSTSLYTVNADEYTTFQDFEFEHNGGQLLEDYANSDYERLYDRISKKRFWGWRTTIAYENEKVYYTKEILYVIVNEGDTAIEDTIKFNKEGSIKRHYSATGSLELAGNGTVKGFKLGLEQKIGTEQTKTVSTSFEESYTIKILVDPGTRLTISIKGEGKVTNGVGKYYRFFKNVKKGGWEIFTITTEYYSLEKVRIDEGSLTEEEKINEN